VSELLAEITLERYLEAMRIESLDQVSHQCHSASVALVASGILGISRVARGTCPGVGSQHSWAVLGDDCYDPQAIVVDPTLWSYVPTVKGIWVGRADERPHKPHGSGSIWEWGKPYHHGGETIELAEDPGKDAKRFLDLIGPLDAGGWNQLLHAPVEEWPAKEIITAAYRTPSLSYLIPIDIVGMVTDEDPNGLYGVQTNRAKVKA
jgi:hypothetical protein